MRIVRLLDSLALILAVVVGAGFVIQRDWLGLRLMLGVALLLVYLALLRAKISKPWRIVLCASALSAAAIVLAGEASLWTIGAPTAFVIGLEVVALLLGVAVAFAGLLAAMLTRRFRNRPRGDGDEV